MGQPTLEIEIAAKIIENGQNGDTSRCRASIL